MSAEDGCQCGAYGIGVNGYHSRGAPRCAWAKLEESLKKQANPTPIGPECFGGSDYPETTDHYAEVLARIASKPNHVSPLCECGQPLNKHSIDGQYDGGCWESRCDGFVDARVVDSAPLPTQLTQPTGRRAELIYELLSWVNKAPIEQVEALAARTRNPSPIALVYIAGPYTAPDAWGVEQNVRRAEELAYEVEAMGAGAVCPHTNSRYIDTRTPYGRKIDITLEMMRRCDAVLFTDDWRRSSGARGEMAEAARLEMPVFYSVASLKRWLEGGNAPAMVAAIGKRDGGA